MNFISFNRACSLSFNANELVIYPTDTLYALGGLADAHTAHRINQLKGRASHKSLSVLAPNMDWIEANLAITPEWVEGLEAKRGGTTFLIAKKQRHDFHWLSKSDCLGVRLLAHDHPAQRWVAELNQPMIATSANFSGQGSVHLADDLDQRLLEQVDYVIEDDYPMSGIASTLWDCQHNHSLNRT